MNVSKLRDISECQNHMILVNSSMRDKTRWPTPSEYSIDFDRPIQNVVGYDILDSTLPRNTYTVDTHNNSVGFGLVIGGSKAPELIGDYFRNARGSTTLDYMMNRKYVPLSEVKVVGSIAPFHSAVVDYNSNQYVSFYSSIPISSHYSTVDDPVPISEKIEFGFSGVYRWRKIGSSTWINAPTTVVGSTTYVIIKLSTGKTYYADAALLLDVPLSDFVEETSTTITGHVTLRVSASSYASFMVYEHEFESHNFTIEEGDHDINSLVTSITNSIPISGGNKALEVFGSSTSNPTNYSLTRKLLYRSPSFFWFDMNRSSARDLLGFSMRSNSRTKYGDFGFPSINDVVGSNNYSLKSPGLVDLNGIRYVKLRCREIEEHRNQINSGLMDPGIGLLKLDSIQNFRTDYNNFRAFTTHPIAKLSRMTLRFEKSDGELYDFKGGDHTIVLSLTTLQPHDFAI